MAGSCRNSPVRAMRPKGQMQISYADVPVTFADGSVVTLCKSTYYVSNLGYGPMDPAVMLSPQVAPQMVGLGLLEAIPAADILAQQDPDDANGDGILEHVTISATASAATRATDCTAGSAQ